MPELDLTPGDWGQLPSVELGTLPVVYSMEECGEVSKVALVDSDNPEWEDNMKVIIASKRMYEALRDLVDYYAGDDNLPNGLEEIVSSVRNTVSDLES